MKKTCESRQNLIQKEEKNATPTVQITIIQALKKKRKMRNHKLSEK